MKTPSAGWPLGPLCTGGAGCPPQRPAHLAQHGRCRAAETHPWELPGQLLAEGLPALCPHRSAPQRELPGPFQACLAGGAALSPSWVVLASGWVMGHPGEPFCSPPTLLPPPTCSSSLLQSRLALTVLGRPSRNVARRDCVLMALPLPSVSPHGSGSSPPPLKPALRKDQIAELDPGGPSPWGICTLLCSYPSEIWKTESLYKEICPVIWAEAKMKEDYIPADCWVQM